MITLGVILLILGVLFWHPLFVAGVILALVGLILLVLHGVGHGLGGRHYW